MVWIASGITDGGAGVAPAATPTTARDSGADMAATPARGFDGAAADFSLAFCAIGAEVAPTTTELRKAGTDSVNVTVSPGATSYSVTFAPIRRGLPTTLSSCGSAAASIAAVAATFDGANSGAGIGAWRRSGARAA